MALATVCPHCNTTFRVASDQLKLRGGIVRCGACKEVFDGNAALVDLGAGAARQAGAPSGIAQKRLHPAPAPEGGPETPAMPAMGSDPVFGQQVEEEILALPVLNDALAPSDTALAPGPDPGPAPDPARARAASVDFQPPLLMRASASAEPAPPFLPKRAPDAARSGRRRAAGNQDNQKHPENQETAPPAAAPAALVAAPPPPQPGQHEPEFVKIGRRKAHTGHRLVLGAGCALLVLLLAAQGLMTFRNELAARHPQTKAPLALACAVLGCRIELPAQIDALSVETGELQSLGADTFSFTTLLRNQASLVQAWPHLELALTDANDKALVRRVFTPADYLPHGVAPATGIAPRSEQAVKFAFELNQVTASGYHIAIFYP